MDMRGVGCAFETTRINNRLGANVERSFGLPLDAGCRARLAEDAAHFLCVHLWLVAARSDARCSCHPVGVGIVFFSNRTFVAAALIMSSRQRQRKTSGASDGIMNGRNASRSKGALCHEA